MRTDGAHPARRRDEVRRPSFEVDAGMRTPDVACDHGTRLLVFSLSGS